MWIEIAKDIFETNDLKGFNHLFNLLTWNAESSVSRYNLYVDTRDVLNTVNFSKLGLDDIKLLNDEFDAFWTTNGNVVYVITDQNTDLNTFNLEEAIRFFNQPASIIIENNKNDSFFILAISHHFDPMLTYGKQHIIASINNGWLQFENAGGCANVENFIEGKLQAYNDLASKNYTHNYKYLRCFVLLDSDKEFPGQEQKPLHVNLEEYLLSKNITNYHLLEKRMMENYMPDEVIESIRDKNTAQWIDVYNQLIAQQKDYLNYKGGFSKETDEHGVRKPLKTEVVALYGISETNFNILDKGLNYPDFKNRFPELFLTSSHVNKFTMRNRAGSDELEKILEKLKKLL